MNLNTHSTCMILYNRIFPIPAPIPVILMMSFIHFFICYDQFIYCYSYYFKQSFVWYQLRVGKKKLFHFYIHLLLLRCSSSLYVDLSFWPFFDHCAWRPFNILKVRSAGNEFPLYFAFDILERFYVSTSEIEFYYL